jgi:hypothetical protein
MNSHDSAIGAPLDLDELLRQDHATLLRRAAEHGVTTGPQPDTDRLRMALVEHHLAAGGRAIGEGVLQVLPEGFGFLRAAANDFAERPTDAYVSPAQIRALDLRTGHRLRGPVRPPRGNERSLALEHVDTVQGRAAGEHRRPPPFEALVPVLPDRRLPLAGDRPSMRLLEVLAPWCHGHRVLVAAPRAAATAQFAAELALAMDAVGERAPRPSVLLFDQRPEAIAAARAMLATTGADVVATDFAQPPARTLDAAELALAAACRDVEAGRDAVLLVDSLTAWVRAGGALGPLGRSRPRCAGPRAGQATVRERTPVRGRRGTDRDRVRARRRRRRARPPDPPGVRAREQQPRHAAGGGRRARTRVRRRAVRRARHPHAPRSRSAARRPAAAHRSRARRRALAAARRTGAPPARARGRLRSPSAARLVREHDDAGARRHDAPPRSDAARPHLSSSMPHDRHVQPPHNTCRNERGQRMTGSSVRQPGHGTRRRLMPHRPDRRRVSRTVAMPPTTRSTSRGT